MGNVGNSFCGTLFHWHKLDRGQWKLVSREKIEVASELYGIPYSVGRRLTYSNVCLSCGDLIFRSVHTVKD